MRKLFTPEQKAAVALATFAGDKTIAQICSEHEVHETQVHEWKKQAKEGLVSVFSDKAAARLREKESTIERLYALVGQRDAELAWIKKRAGLPLSS